jgi:hypothetical protein
VINTQLETDVLNILEPTALTEPLASKLTAPIALEASVEPDNEPAINAEVMNTTDEQIEATPKALPTPDKIAKRYSRT